ncbi:MAG: murein biosynthesis integral membrane protein MurJ [Sulfurovum sp.]|nr:murein biosynthesis integral membrane protein MurJ [Sulfurovaceae bacterium]
MKLKSILTNSFGILFSRVTGLFRDILMASALGTSIYSDMFFIAFKIPNLFRRIFAEGAFTQSFMPSFIASKHKGVFAVAIFLRFIIFLIIMSIIVSFFPEVLTKALAVGWSDETIKMASPLTAINFWYLDLVFIITFLATLLQYKEHFATTALSTALLNLSMITALWIYMKDSPETIAYAISFAVLIGGLLQILAHIYTIHKLNLHKLLIGGWKYKKVKNIDSEKKRFNSLFIPAIWGNSTAQINAFIDTLLASFLVSGSISYLFYANRIFQLPLALFAIATATALFPSISKAIKNGKDDEAYENLDKAFWILTFALGFAMVGGITLAEPIIWLLFERGNFTESSTIETVGVLNMYMIGLVPFGLAKLFSLFLYASHRQTEAAKIATYSLVINIISSLILMEIMGVQGLALAGSIGGWVLFIFTVEEVGTQRFINIIQDTKVIYFIISMATFWILLSWINNILVEIIR